MSGVTCVVNLDGAPVAPELVQAMTEQVAWRGPHGCSYLVRSNAGFGYLALHSTPESLHEQQPLEDREAGLVLVADARLDNRDDLIKQLGVKAKGETVVTDAELILHAFRKWVQDSPRYLIGDFAFVIWDSRARHIFAARDPLGVRSLHYARFGNDFCVTSEAQQILRHPRASRRLDEAAVVEWLTGNVSHSACMFQDVRAVPPGNALLAGAGRYRLWRFWDIDPGRAIRYRKLDEYKEHLLHELDQSVRVRLRTDRTVIASELSGGMDSTTVTALAKRALDGSGKTLITASCQYKSTPSCDETAFIQSAADHIGVATNWIDAEANGAFGYPKLHVHSLESPWVRHYPLMDHEFGCLRAAGAGVVLSGTGGDEVATGGMDVFFHRLWHGDLKAGVEVAQFCRRYQRRLLPMFYRVFVEPGIPARLDSLLRGIAGRKQRKSRGHAPWLTAKGVAIAQASLDLKDEERAQFRARAAQSRYEQLFRGVLPAAVGANSLVAAKHGIEVRHPFLDRRVIEFCFGIPIQLWSRDLFSKWVLRYATAELLPENVRWRVDKSVATEVFGKGIAANIDYVREVFAFNGKTLTDLYDSRVLAREFDDHFASIGGIRRRDIDFALSIQCWLHTNREFLFHDGIS